MNGIQINEVTKTFGDTVALNRVSLTFEPIKYMDYWVETALENRPF